MFGADKGTSNLLDGKKLSIGIVQARFNEGITDALFQACHEELLKLGVLEKHITHVQGARCTGSARGLAGHGRTRRF